MTMRVLIVDDHPVFRGGVIGMLGATGDGPGFEQADTLAEALRMLGADPAFDLVLLDLKLPDTVGTSGLESLRQRHPRLPVMVMSADCEPATIERCMRAGAAGYLPKTATRDRLAAAVRAVANGGVYIPRDATGLPQRTWGLRAGLPRPGAGGDGRQLGLTDRQTDVLHLILRGLPNKLIGRQLELAEGTVKVHVSAVLRALGVRTRTQAVVAASRMGLRVPD
jgi:DNA-binding NarL/FixJ family response regulator